MQYPSEAGAQPPPSAEQRPRPRIVMSVRSALNVERIWCTPTYGACSLDEAWLARLRRLHQLAGQEGIEEMEVPEPHMTWGEQPDGVIERSYLVVSRDGFRFRGWFDDYFQGYVETDDLFFGRADRAIELFLASRRVGQGTGSAALGDALAQLTEQYSNWEIRMCLLTTGDLYAGFPNERAPVEQRLIEDDSLAA